MDIADRIAQKEYKINLLKNDINMLEGIPGMDPNYIKRHYDDIEDLKKSIEDDRKIQLAEAQKSGRKNWREDALKYALVVFVVAALIKIIDFILSKI